MLSPLLWRSSCLPGGSIAVPKTGTSLPSPLNVGPRDCPLREGDSGRGQQEKAIPHSSALEVTQGLKSEFLGFHRGKGGKRPFTLRTQLPFYSFPGGGLPPIKIIGGFFTWTPDGIPTLSNITIRIPRGTTRLKSLHGLGVPFRVIAEVPPSTCLTEQHREKKKNQHVLSTSSMLALGGYSGV